ncbi:MAG: 4Fe-4S binding protein [Thermodesulfobacteriota bacterium]
MPPQAPTKRKHAEDFVSARNRLLWVTTTVFIGIITVGWMFPWFGYFVPVCVAGAILPAFLRGRRWCDWWCPRGSFLNQCLGPLSRKKALPKFLRSTRFRLIMMGIMMTVFSVRIYQLWPDPVRIGGFLILFLTITTVAGAFVGIAYKPRSWCAFCPVGTMAKWAGTARYPLRITKDCTECKLCESVCPLGIAPYSFRTSGVVADWDCLKCRLCVVKCPQRCLQVGDGELPRAA